MPIQFELCTRQRLAKPTRRNPPAKMGHSGKTDVTLQTPQNSLKVAVDERINLPSTFFCVCALRSLFRRQPPATDHEPDPAAAGPAAAERVGHAR
jgi:hypothetical protein